MTPTKKRFAQHREEILRFWEKCYDPESGGYYAWVGPTGEVWKREHWSLLIQARLLYNYSEGIRAGIDIAAQNAERLYAFITGKMHVPKGWYAGIYEGEVTAPDVLDAYSNLFVVIGMARYALATGSSEVLDRARQLLAIIEQETIRGDLADVGVVGRMGAHGRRISSRDEYTGNNNLHYLEALARLRDAGVNHDLDQKVEKLRTFFLRYILDKERMFTHDRFRDSFNDPWSGPGAYVSLGHALEWVDFFRGFPGQALDEATEKGIMAHAIEQAVRDDGLFEDSFYLTEGRCAGGADFWPQVEAVKTYNLAAQVYGAPYDEIARRLATYYFDHFVDSDGGVFSEIDRNGVVTSRFKGGYWKCDYHSMRMCVDVTEREGGAFDE
jgi:mannose/cellobiose epimerase-like protein (N-acyl-D-glucosamine 2-epimerase family)